MLILIIRCQRLTSYPVLFAESRENFAVHPLIRATKATEVGTGACVHMKKRIANRTRLEKAIPAEGDYLDAFVRILLAESRASWREAMIGKACSCASQRPGKKNEFLRWNGNQDLHSKSLVAQWDDYQIYLEVTWKKLHDVPQKRQLFAEGVTSPGKPRSADRRIWRHKDAWHFGYVCE